MAQTPQIKVYIHTSTSTESKHMKSHKTTCEPQHDKTQQNDCALSEDSESLWVFAVRSTES